MILIAYSTQPALLAPSSSPRDGCGCALGCACRAQGGRCTCSRGGVSLGARCGCGGQPVSTDAPSTPLDATLARGPAPEEPVVGVLLRTALSAATDLAVGLEPPDPP